MKLCAYKSEPERNKKICSLSVEKKIGEQLHMILYLNTLLKTRVNVLYERPIQQVLVQMHKIKLPGNQI